MDQVLDVINLIDKLLLEKAFDYQNERLCQDQMETYFTSLGLIFIREHRLDIKNRIDFFFPKSGIGLEIKAGKKWSKREVYRQLERYAGIDAIKGIILATGRSQGLPETVNNVPIKLHNLGVAHL